MRGEMLRKIVLVLLVTPLLVVGGCVYDPLEGDLDMGGYNIINMADPVNDQDAATKAYVDERTNYAGMYRYESIDVTDIQQVGEWHLLNEFTISAVAGGWAFHDGEQVPITAYANNGDGKTQVTSAGHLMIDGDICSIAGTANYDGVWIVEQVAANTFVIDILFVADDGASVGEHGAHFQSTDVLSSGFYLITYSLSIQPAAPNAVAEVATYYNATLQTESVAQVKLGAITDYQNISGFSFVDLSTLGLVGLSIRNKTNAGDFTVIHGNMTLVKLD
jgi:hypothetical protein